MNNTTTRRNAHFLAAVCRAAARRGVSGHDVAQIVSAVAAGPAPEFYISYDAARRYVSLALRNKLPKSLSPTRRQKWADITSRVTALRDRRPQLSVCEALAYVLATCHAPSFYIAPRSALNLYYKLVNNTTL